MRGGSAANLLFFFESVGPGDTEGDMHPKKAAAGWREEVDYGMGRVVSYIEGFPLPIFSCN